MKHARGQKLSLLPYIPIGDLCTMWGLKNTPINRSDMRRKIVARVEAGEGKLDKYDPRTDPGKVSNRFLVTETTLRALFPERFDKQSDLIKHLEKRLKEYDDKFADLYQQIARERRLTKERDEILAKAIAEIREDFA